MDVDRPWQRFAPGSPEGSVCAAAAARLARADVPACVPPPVPVDLGRTPTGLATTQAALGRTLLDVNRAAPEVGARIVTVSPDVSSSTNLGGWVNKVGVWSHTERVDWFADDAETILHWRERPDGQHIELGISEVNLVGAIGELGATWSRWGQPLLPIGVLYDPFVERALEPWSFGIYAGGQSILVGTPAGVSLAGEGGAHQSIKTPSIGLEQPGCVCYEPAFALDTEWALLAALGQLGRSGGQSAYLRLSTRPVDQTLAAIPTDPAARERRRRHVVAGGYVLRRTDRPALTIAAMGAMVPEALQAADRLDALGFPTEVVCVTSADLLFRAVQARRGLASGSD
jgi:pyruvate dehydrogenase E1 component